MKVLMVEDDAGIIEIVDNTMKLRWPELNFISTSLGKEGIELVKKELPDIVILDLGLPDIDGFQVLQQIRDFSDVLVVILSARGEEEDRIKGLEAGADEYMIKPFSPRVLIAQLQALLRRCYEPEITTTTADKSDIRSKLTIDTSSQTVSVEGNTLKMGPREYDLLNYLVNNGGKTVPNQELLEKVFPDQDADVRYLRVYMNKLFDKIGDNPHDPTIIINEEDKGYKFVAGEDVLTVS